ncbi:hypothetical protein [Chryseobacterium indologenes]|uniref:hypothetical protein n=1 Tax=Chryseobacterium indologenes TaxID=253 RepID=UPI0040593817
MCCKYPIYLLLSLIVLSCQRKDQVVKRDNEPDIHILQGEDTEMNTAIENAQKSLYTTRVLRKRMSQKEREQMDKENGFTFENE